MKQNIMKDISEKTCGEILQIQNKILDEGAECFLECKGDIITLNFPFLEIDIHTPQGVKKVYNIGGKQNGK